MHPLRAEISGGLSAAARARRFLDEVEDRIHPSLRDDVRFLVNELVTNSAVLAGVTEGESVELVLSPSPLYLVDRLTAHWGVSYERGTTVWFELLAPDRAERAESNGGKGGLEGASR
jgi:hypothetical protein